MGIGLNLTPSFSVSFDLEFFQFGMDFAIIFIGLALTCAPNQTN